MDSIKRAVAAANTGDCAAMRIAALDATDAMSFEERNGDAATDLLAAAALARRGSADQAAKLIRSAARKLGL